MKKSEEKKKKMATSREVYDRIIWDVRLDSSAFIIGFQERTSSTGLQEKSLAQWATDGDIPWHRIRYIRCGDVVVWNREQHLDLVSTGQLPAAAWKSNTTDNNVTLLRYSTAATTTRPVYRYDSQGWQAYELSPVSINLDTLTVVSFNVLCNLYETEKIQTEKRLPAIVEHLRQCNADIIAIQEATPPLVELLLSQYWVHKYYISSSSAAQDVQPYGNLLLSRLPFTLVEHKFSEHKRVLIGTWHIKSQPLHVAVVHLTSDRLCRCAPRNRAQNAVEIRKHQLSTIIAYLQQLGNSAIVGDFNTRSNEQEEMLTCTGFVDVWQELHPYAPGYTFDPERNSLAALMSLQGKPARFDRILLRSQNKDWIPHSIDLFACEPIAGTEGNIYPSDHFGICAVLKSSDSPLPTLSTVRPVYQSAVVVIPPDNIIQAIQVIRQRYDRNFKRWMPHINLIYGFLPESYFVEAVEIIAPALTKLQPFNVTLAGFETFTHRKSSTAWLHPVAVPETALHDLQALLQSLFPQCDEQSTKSSAGFTPHLSVGQFPSAEKALAELPQWHPVSFTVDSIALISRRGDEPFEVRHIVSLGSGGSLERLSEGEKELIKIINHLEPELTQAQQLQRDTVLEVVKQACAECLGFPPSLHLLGSARLGVQSPQSDLDVICLIPTYLSGETFFVRVQQCLAGLCDRTQVVLEARVPVLRLRLDGISVDLLYARMEGAENWKGASKNQIWDQTLQKFDSISLTAILGVWEADLIVDVVSQHVTFDSYRWLLRAVRGWAKARHIYGNALGFLGGFSWALLCAWSCTYYVGNDTSLDALLANFFQLLNQHDWNQAIALTDAGRQYQVKLPRAQVPVVTSIEPIQNTARNVTRSTAQTLHSEFVRSAALTEQIKAGKLSWASLFEPTDLHKENCRTSLGILDTEIVKI